MCFEHIQFELSKFYPGGPFDPKELIYIKCTEWACNRFSMNDCVKVPNSPPKKTKGIITLTPKPQVRWLLFTVGL